MASKEGTAPSKSDFAKIACSVNQTIIDLRSSPKNKADASRLKRKFPGQGVADALQKSGEATNYLAEAPPKKKRRNRDLSAPESGIVAHTDGIDTPQMPKKLHML